MRKTTTLLSTSFFIFFFFCLSATQVTTSDQCQLVVKTVDLNNVNKRQVSAEFLEYLQKYKRGFNIIARDLPIDASHFTVVIERPLFKGGFLGYSYESSIRSYNVTREEILESQKRSGQPELIIDSLVCAGYLPGEKINYALFTDNNKIVAKTSLIPNPLEKMFSDGKAKIQMEYFGGNGSWYAIKFTGFENEETISFQSISGTEEIPEQKFKVLNTVGMHYCNGVIGAEGGKSILTFRRASGDKVVFVLPWGYKLIPYLEGKVAFGEIP